MIDIKPMTGNQNTYTCPECGAQNWGDGTCQDFFDSFLNLEFTNPQYGEVHALTVGTYMIQHNRYSDAALLWITENLKKYLDENWSGEKLRQIAMERADEIKRKSKIFRASNEPLLPAIKWKMTIADVAKDYTDADSYRILIKQWARTTLDQIDRNIERPKN